MTRDLQVDEALMLETSVSKGGYVEEYWQEMQTSKQIKWLKRKT